MNIGIDASLLKINLAGMGIYVKEMVELFSVMDLENHYFLFTNADFACQINVSERFVIIKKEVKPHIIWLQTVLPKLLKEYKIDIFWQPDHILPPKVKGIDYYVTVHDLSAYKFHNVAMKRVEIVYKTFLKRTCKDATRVITISQFTKRDMIETLGVPESKIDVIYNGDSPYKGECRLKRSEMQECLDKYHVSKPYFLFVGTINPRKNVLTIVKAFHEFRERNVMSAQLVLVGEYGWNSDNVLQEIKESKYLDDILVTGFVSESEKEILYRNSSCFIFPSILEGFGLPVLEAMSVGVLTILSHVSSLPEVGGEAAYYLADLFDYKEMADRMVDIMTMKPEDKKKVQALGYEQASKFSREDCARKILALFQRYSNRI